MRSVDNLRACVGFFFCFLFVLICFSRGALSKEPDNTDRDPSSSLKTISRTDDYVVIRGSKFTHNLHKDIEKMSLLASANGEIQPIPFQIDEINPDGEWVLPNSPPYIQEKKNQEKKRIDKDDDNGLLDDNDELAFMIRDSGDRIGQESYPGGAELVDEIMLVDPNDDGRSWVYLCSYNADPPRSTKDYVQYRFPENRVTSDNFEVGFSLEVPISWDYLAFTGGDNLIDRLKMRVLVMFFGIKFFFDEEDWKSELSCYKDGPVRVIRRVRSSIYLTKRLRTSSADSESIYYDSIIVVPYRVKVPISPAVFGKLIKITVNGALDMQNMHGWRVKTEVDHRWLSIDGKMDEDENNAITKGAAWYLLSGPEHCMLQRIIHNRSPDGSPQELPLKTAFLYVDDDDAADPPEFVPGQSPKIGYLVTELSKLRKGTFYLYNIYHMINHEYQENLEERYLWIEDQPIRPVVN